MKDRPGRIRVFDDTKLVGDEIEDVKFQSGTGIAVTVTRPENTRRARVVIENTGGVGGPPTGPAGGDLSGTYPNPQVQDDSHNHAAATAPGAAHPGLATHDALGLSTDAELATHAGLPNVHHAEVHAIDGADHTGTLLDAQIPATIARDAEVTTAVSNHEAAGDPHPAYALDTDLQRFAPSQHGHPFFEGEEGPEGPMGFGVPGSPGAAGATGTTGATGATGAQGIPGPPGLDAEEAEFPWTIPGPAGPAGATGGTGGTGATGAQGPAGPSVPGFDAEEPELPWIIPGPQGLQGTTGSTGGTGPTGATGVGIMGPPGFDAEEPEMSYIIPGPAGAAGAAGSAGSTGAAGAAGLPGAPGLDAEDPLEPLMIPGPIGAASPTSFTRTLALMGA